MQELIHGCRSLFDIGMERVHDCPCQTRIHVGTTLQKILGGGSIVMQCRPTVEDLALPWMFERNQAITGDSKRKNVNTAIRCSTSHNFGGHVERSPGPVSGCHERRRCRDGQSKIDQFDASAPRQTDEVAGANVAMDVVH